MGKLYTIDRGKDNCITEICIFDIMNSWASPWYGLPWLANSWRSRRPGRSVYKENSCEEANLCVTLVVTCSPAWRLAFCLSGQSLSSTALQITTTFHCPSSPSQGIKLHPNFVHHIWAAHARHWSAACIPLGCYRRQIFLILQFSLIQ